MVKVNHDEVKSEIVNDVFYSEVESKFSPYHNLSFGEDCDNKPRITNVDNYNCEKNGKFKEISWLLDSGCTDHVVKFGNLTKNSKHIEVQYHYVNENYEKGVIDIVKIETEKNIADIFTKSLCKDKFIKNRNALNVI